LLVSLYMALDSGRGLVQWNVDDMSSCLATLESAWKSSGGGKARGDGKRRRKLQRTQSTTSSPRVVGGVTAGAATALDPAEQEQATERMWRNVELLSKYTER
jgi:hypothetical protein